jgi:hypothetical protein
MIAPHQRKAMTDTTATIPTQAHDSVTTAAAGPTSRTRAQRTFSLACLRRGSRSGIFPTRSRPLEPNGLLQGWGGLAMKVIEHHERTILPLLLLLIVTTPSSAHDVYMDWQRPGLGTMCCSGDPIAGDCYPTQARFIQGKWYALRREDKKWLAIPDKAVLTDVDNPDGRAHLCAPEPGKYLQHTDLVFCFNPPTLGM